MTTEKPASGTHVLISVSDSKALTLYKKYADSASYSTHGWEQHTYIMHTACCQATYSTRYVQ
jgi:hypothetical protein